MPPLLPGRCDSKSSSFQNISFHDRTILSPAINRDFRMKINLILALLANMPIFSACRYFSLPLPFIMRSLIYLALIGAISTTGAMPGLTLHQSKLPAQVGLPQCDCYVVTGPDPGYFQHYKFYDFRSVRPEDRFPKTFPPASMRSNESVCWDDKYVSVQDTGFLDDWVIEEWGRNSSKISPITVINSYENVFFTGNGTEGAGDKTYLTLRTTRLKHHTSTAEIVHQLSSIFHCSFRVRLRMLSGERGNISTTNDSHTGNLLPSNHPTQPPPTGAVAGVFTYHPPDIESDIEILTSDPPGRV